MTTKSLVREEELVTFFYCLCTPRKIGAEDVSSRDLVIIRSSGFT